MEKNDGEFDTGFRIEEKLNRFVNADVFDFEEELIDLQIIQWYFEGLVNQGSADQDAYYATYKVLKVDEEPPSDHELWSEVQNTKGDVVYNVWRGLHEKGSYSWFGEFANFVQSLVALISSCFKLIGTFIYSMFKAIGELARLFIDIVFLP